MGKTGRHHEIFYARTISAAEVLKQLSLSWEPISVLYRIYIYIVAVGPINNPLNQPVDQSQQKLHNHFGSIDRLSLVTLFIFIC